MDDIMYPALPQCDPLDGDEAIAMNGKKLATVLGFWRWAYSNINDNSSRGRFAEYIVCAALGCAGGTRSEWDSYDILWKGIKVEVKSSAYIQSWAQRGLSKISFGIRPTRSWDPSTCSEGDAAERQADVYVFCIENCKEQKGGNPNPLDLSQWEFRAIATDALNDLGPQKTISLSQLDRMGAIRTASVFELPDAIQEAIEK